MGFYLILLLLIRVKVLIRGKMQARKKTILPCFMLLHTHISKERSEHVLCGKERKKQQLRRARFTCRRQGEMQMFFFS
jgi:hypothetical protein